MSAWRVWHPAVLSEWRMSRCPCLVRFARGSPVASSPARLFPSLWANIDAFSPAEHDFLAQCVEHVRYGLEMCTNAEWTTAAMERPLLCDIILLPDGRPCFGWFRDEFDDRHYTAVLRALESRWRAAPAALWALRDATLTEQVAALAGGGWFDCFVLEASEWSRERLVSCANRHSRCADANPIARETPEEEAAVWPKHCASAEGPAERFRGLVRAARESYQPSERDACVASALRLLPTLLSEVRRCEASMLQLHALGDRACDAHHPRGDVGLMDADALRAAFGPSAPEAVCAGTDAPGVAVPFGGLGMSMPGVGLDADGYVTALLAACDRLAEMTAMEEAMGPRNDAQRAVFALRHALRVHVTRRFAFANASELWGSTLAARAKPFLRAAQHSLQGGQTRAVVRFRDARYAPGPFDAAAEPSTRLGSLGAPNNATALFAECGTLQELEHGEDEMRSLQCRVHRGGDRDGDVEFTLSGSVRAKLIVAIREVLEKETACRFADILVYVSNGSITLTPNDSHYQNASK